MKRGPDTQTATEWNESGGNCVLRDRPPYSLFLNPIEYIFANWKSNNERDKDAVKDS